MQRSRCSLQNPEIFVTSSQQPAKPHLLVLTPSLFILLLSSLDFAVASRFISTRISSIFSISSWLASPRRAASKFESIATLCSPIQLPPRMFLWMSVYSSGSDSSITVNVDLLSLEIFNLKHSKAYDGNVKNPASGCTDKCWEVTSTKFFQMSDNKWVSEVQYSFM